MIRFAGGFLGICFLLFYLVWLLGWMGVLRIRDGIHDFLLLGELEGGEIGL